MCYQRAAQLYASLAQCGGGGNLGVKHTEAWTYYSDKLLGALHASIDDLYQQYEPGWLDFRINFP